MRQRAILQLDIYELGTHAIYEIFKATFALKLCDKIFDAIAPEFEQKADYAHLFIIFALLPGKRELYFTTGARVGHEAFPETRRISGELQGRTDPQTGNLLSRWLPARIHFRALQADQRAPGLFAHHFERGEFVERGQQ